MLQVSKLTKSFSNQLLFDDVTFNVTSGEKIAFIGRNGTGKSTLFNILNESIDYDGGTVTKTKGYVIGKLSQNIKFESSTVLNEVISSIKKEDDYEEISYKAKKVLNGLGLNDEHDKSPNELSSGKKIKLNLAKLLVDNCDLLLLDEPTNYLDVINIEWLKKYIKSQSKEFIIISHDRDFLNETCNHCMYLYDANIKKLKGNINKVLEQVKEEKSITEKKITSQKEKIDQIQSFIDKNRANSKKASLVQSRVKLLEKLKTEFESLQVQNDQTISLKFNYETIMSKRILEINNINFDYDNKKNDKDKLINDFSLDIFNGDKICILGENAKGKSTLINLIAGTLNPLSGTIQHNEKNNLAVFNQSEIELMNLELSIEQVLLEGNSFSREEVRKVCGRLLFKKDFIEKKIKVLSGGEKARVLLAKIILKKCNFLLLDEPTNHLDIETIEILISAINDFKGTVLIVSHNKYFLSKVSNKYLVFLKNKIEVLECSLEKAIDSINNELLPNKSVEKKDINLVSKSRKFIKEQRANIIREKSQVLRPLKEKVLKLEITLEKLDEVILELQNKLIDTSKYSGEKLQLFLKDLNTYQKEYDTKIAEWESLSNNIEELESDFNNRLNSI